MIKYKSCMAHFLVGREGAKFVGKNLKGKELGKGLRQRKDGLYYARCVDADGLRSERCFANLTQARNWQKEQQYYALRSQRTEEKSTMTVDEWFSFWQDNLLVGLSPNTVRNYRERYERNAKSVLGHLPLTEVRPMHCKAVFNRMNESIKTTMDKYVHVTDDSLFQAIYLFQASNTPETHPKGE